MFKNGSKIMKKYNRSCKQGKTGHRTELNGQKKILY